jgi:hypothetical protein
LVFSGFLLYKICYIVYVNRNTIGKSKIGSDMGPNNNKPNPKNKSNLTLDSTAVKKDRKRIGVSKALDFKFNEFKNNT